MDYSLPLRPAEFAENQIIDGILTGRFSIDTPLPAERELAGMIGVTRPTLREALQRMARDGWLEIRQGKPTRVRDYWHEGSLGVLGAIARRSSTLPPGFVCQLLDVRLALAPVYASLAVETQPAEVVRFLASADKLDGTPESYASFDWLLHHRLSVLSGNPIYTLILNGFSSLYGPVATRYFQHQTNRDSSQEFYAGLRKAASDQNALQASEITRQAMQVSIEHWKCIGK